MWPSVDPRVHTCAYHPNTPEMQDRALIFGSQWARNPKINTSRVDLQCTYCPSACAGCRVSLIFEHIQTLLCELSAFKRLLILHSRFCISRLYRTRIATCQPYTTVVHAKATACPHHTPEDRARGYEQHRHEDTTSAIQQPGRPATVLQAATPRLLLRTHTHTTCCVSPQSRKLSKLHAS